MTKPAAQTNKRDVQKAKAEIEKAMALGVKDYFIRTCEDSRVCDVCKKCENKKFPLKKAKIGVNYPPLHDGCRCYAEPIIRP